MDLTDYDDPLTFHVMLSLHYRTVALASYSSAVFFITQPKAQSQRQICDKVCELLNAIQELTEAS